MKVKNFPGRKNKRRLKVLDQLNSKKDKIEDDEILIEKLESRIIDPQDAKKIKTKKLRGDGKRKR